MQTRQAAGAKRGSGLLPDDAPAQRGSIGASVGAVTGAVIAGNTPGDRGPSLREFRERAKIPFGVVPHGGSSSRHDSGVHTALALLLGDPGFANSLPTRRGSHGGSPGGFP